MRCGRSARAFSPLPTLSCPTQRGALGSGIILRAPGPMGLDRFLRRIATWAGGGTSWLAHVGCIEMALARKADGRFAGVRRARCVIAWPPPLSAASACRARGGPS